MSETGERSALTDIKIQVAEKMAHRKPLINTSEHEVFTKKVKKAVAVNETLSEQAEKTRSARRFVRMLSGKVHKKLEERAGQAKRIKPPEIETKEKLSKKRSASPPTTQAKKKTPLERLTSFIMNFVKGKQLTESQAKRILRSTRS